MMPTIVTASNLVMVATNPPPKERVLYFKRMAAEAERASRNARGEQREAYRKMAAQWRKLAEDVESRKQQKPFRDHRSK